MKSKSIYWFDLDETLFSHGNRIRVSVKDQSGNVVHTLNNQEYNTHILPEQHEYDFSQFRSSRAFENSAEPIPRIIKKALALSKKHRVEIMTAREDFDDKDHFGDVLRRHGIDFNKIHVRRAGNIQAETPAECKKIFINELINTNGYTHVHLYDDSIDNLKAFLSLKHEHPHVKFHAYHVVNTDNQATIKRCG